MSAHEQQIWYYGSTTGERVGPISIRELSSLAGKGTLGPKTLVWSPGYPDWIPAEQISDLLMTAREAVPTVAAPSPVPVPVTVSAPASPSDDKPLVETIPIAAAPTVIASTESTPRQAEEATALPAAPSSSEPPLELKPQKGSYLFPRIVLGLVLSLVLGGIVAGGLLAAEQQPWPGLVVFAVGSLLAMVGSFASYRKERYELHGTRVICHRGGLMSDQTTELEIRNITHVKLKLPWLRYKFYGVGNVIVETAGNSHPVVMRAIAEPEAIYDGMKERMKQNGYDLTQQQLFFEDRPAIIGVLVECLGMFIGSIFAILYFGAVIAGTRQSVKSAPEFDGVAYGFLGVAAVGLIAFIIVRFLDYRRRTYRVFNDMVVYDEGFLTRHNAFIPYENIADSTTNCTFIDRLFGLYDVQVSCQGSSKDIKFRRLRQGAALSAAIDQLVVVAQEKKKTKSAAKQSLASQSRPRRAEPEAIAPGEAMVAELKMHAGRALIPMLFLLPLVPIWLQAIIRVISTEYSVRPGSVRHAYRFLTSTDREFAYDKITGVVVKQNLWDRMFGTLTIKFWSIGSGQSIEFAHVSASQLDVPALLRQAGIPAPSPEPFEAPAAFSLFTWLRAQIRFIPLLLVLSAIFVFLAIEIDPVLYYLFTLPVVFLIGTCIYSKMYASRQRLRFHDHHVEAETGIIAKQFSMVRYSNIKRTVVTRYPGGEQGSFQIFVAGEEEVQQAGVQQQQQKGRMKVLRPYSFTTHYLPKVRETALLLDDILCGRVDPVPQAVPGEPLEVLLEAPRSVANAIVKLLLLSILLVFPIVLLPITLPFTIIRVKRWRYRVEATRIVSSWGVLYRRESSIILDRVDSIQQSQGPVNKMCKNGNVTIMTAGSSKPEFKIIDSPAYLELYRIIRERSE